MQFLKTYSRFADPFVKPAVVWSRSSKEICVLGLDGCLSFFSVAEEPDVPVYAGVGKLQWHATVGCMLKDTLP